MTTHRSIRFLTHPSLGQVKEHVRAELLGLALSRRLGCLVTVETTTSYDELVDRAVREDAEVIWAPAELCDRLAPRARAILRAVRSGRTDYRAALICRADEPLKLDDLEGRAAAWVAPWSAAGYLLPRALLAERGFEPDGFLGEQKAWGSYRRALGAVLDGEADFSAIYCAHIDERMVRSALAEHVGGRELELMPFAYTAPTAADGLIITGRTSEAMARSVVEALVGLGSEGSGLLPLLGLFDTDGFALQRPDGRAEPAPPCGDGLVMIEVTADLLCQRVSSQSGRVFGQAAGAHAGRPLWEILGREAAAPVAALVGEAFRSRVGGRVDFRIESADQVRWWSAEFALFAGPAQEPTGTVLLREVTEQRALEEEVYRLASYPLLTPDPVLEIDRDGKVAYANRAAHEKFPGLLSQGVDHPIIAAMLAVSRSPRRGFKGVLREVELGEHLWKLTVVSPPDADFIRAFVVDLSDGPNRAGAQRTSRLGSTSTFKT
jgi:two-component system, NtrC family, sensor kinase